MSVDDLAAKLTEETRRRIAEATGQAPALPKVEPASFRPDQWAFDWQEAIARAYGIDAAYLADIIGGPGPRADHARHLQLDIYNLACDYCTGRAE